MIFILTILLGAAFVLGLLYFRARQEIRDLVFEKQQIKQEKQIVVDFMHDMVEALGDTPEREELFQEIVHAAILSTGALSACVFELGKDNLLQGVAVEGLFPPQKPLPESSKIKLTTRAKFIEQVLKSEKIDLGEGLIGEVAKRRKSVLVEDATMDDRVTQHDDRSLEIRSMIAAPIFFRDRMIGVLAVVNPANGMAFNETDLSLVQSMAEQAGLAIHNADLLNLQIEKKKIDLDLTLASNIQQLLLPREFPQVKDLDIDALYSPAQKVGGDLYDIFSIDENRIGVAIADVSGKGIPASLLMTICRSNLRHYSRTLEDPAEVVQELNRAMAADMRHDMFITLVYAVVDMEKNTVELARCGHEMPLLAHPDNESGVWLCEPMKSEGMAIGMVTPELFDAVIQKTTIPFEKDSILVLFTDGVTEMTNQDGVEFSSGRLADVIKTLRTRSARELNQGIVESVDRFTGGATYQDDLTLVTLKHL
ncbi:MAG: SpoIIE family protein phosphatase [Opitutales bacterium]|nr:SpoIIE family protein phosphatase [Opitutales bacterium]